MDINCEVQWQELNKHLLFIYNKAIESYRIFIVNNVIINVIRVSAILFITVFSITINAGVSILIIIINVINIDTITFIIIMIFILVQAWILLDNFPLFIGEQSLLKGILIGYMAFVF